MFCARRLFLRRFKTTNVSVEQPLPCDYDADKKVRVHYSGNNRDVLDTPACCDLKSTSSKWVKDHFNAEREIELVQVAPDEFLARPKVLYESGKEPTPIWATNIVKKLDSFQKDNSKMKKDMNELKKNINQLKKDAKAQELRNAPLRLAAYSVFARDLEKIAMKIIQQIARTGKKESFDLCVCREKAKKDAMSMRGVVHACDILGPGDFEVLQKFNISEKDVRFAVDHFRSVSETVAHGADQTQHAAACLTPDFNVDQRRHLTNLYKLVYGKEPEL